MYLNEMFELYKAHLVTDDIGQQIEEESKRIVFGGTKSISQTEYFNAGQQGLKPSKCFVIRAIEYMGEVKVIYEGKIYYIYRTYEKGDYIELYGEVKGHGEY